MFQLNYFKKKMLSRLAYYLAKLLHKTLKTTVIPHTQYQEKAVYLCAFWHGKQFLLIVELAGYHHAPVGALVSPSRDGDILEGALEKLGYVVVRGSSRSQSVSGTKKLIRALKAGISMGWGMDGPIGPREKVKPGMTFLARKLGLPILPVGIALEKKWVFHKAWDKFEIPKPFSKGLVCFGDPFWVCEKDDLTQANQLLEKRLCDIQQLAEEKVIQP